MKILLYSMKKSFSYLYSKKIAFLGLFFFIILEGYGQSNSLQSALLSRFANKEIIAYAASTHIYMPFKVITRAKKSSVKPLLHAFAAPTVSNFDDVTFAENTVNATAQVIDNDITYANGGNTNYNNNLIRVSYSVGGATAHEDLDVQNQGTGAGQIGVSGNNISYGGTVFAVKGMTNNGINGNNLFFVMDNDATDAAIEALLQNITYRNDSDNPATTRTLSITVENNDGISAAETAVITITSENDLPTSADGSETTDEDINFTFGISDFTFNDVDAGATFGGIEIVLVETEGDLEYNGVDVTTGTVCADVTLLVFKPIADENGSPYATFTFKVRDNAGGNSAPTYTMTMNVTSVNDLPTGADGSETTDEDMSYTFGASDFTFNDADGTFGGIRIESVETNGDLEYNGTDVAASTVCPNVTLLEFEPFANTNGSPYAIFTFKVRDNNGAFSTANYTMTINVTAVNDAPALGTPTAGNLAYAEGAAATAISPTGLGITDVDNANLTSATVTINTNYQNGFDVLALTPLPTGITGANFVAGTGVLTITGTGALAQFTTALNQVTFQNTGSDPTATGATRQISFQVNDGISSSNTRNRTIDITAANNAPVITEGLSVNVNMTEDGTPTAFNLTLNATDSDNTGAQLTWSIFDQANNGTASASGTGLSKVISYSPNANFNGTDVFIVRVSDGSASDDITVNVNITAVNDEPTANAQTTNALENTEQGILLTGQDGDAEVTQTLTYVITTLPTTGTLSATSGGVAITGGLLPFTLPTNQVFFTPALDDVNTRTFQFRVQDNGGTANGGDNQSPNATITVNITLINNQPAANTQNLNTLENTELSITLTGEDGDNNATQALTYIITQLPSRGTLSETSGGAVINTVPFTLSDPNIFYQPETNNNGAQSFFFRVQDNGGTANGGIDMSNSVGINISVQAVNNEPTLDAIPAQNPITRNAVPNARIVALTGIGSGANDEFQAITITATSNNTAVVPNPVIAYTSPAVTGTLTYQAIGSVAVPTNITITVTVQDDGGTANGGDNSFTRTFIIPILPLPDAPSNFTPTSAGLNQINLSWDNVPSNEGFEIWRSLTLNANYALVATLPANATFYADNNLTTEEIHYYQIRTLKASGNSDFSATITATTLLKKPENLKAEATSANSIFLSWENASNLNTAFKIQRATSLDFTNNLAEINITNAGALTHQDTNLDDETKYYYRIKTLNDALNPNTVFESEYSEAFNLFTLLLTPTQFNAISESSTQNKIAWRNDATSAQGFLIQRSAVSNNFDPIGNPSFQQNFEFAGGVGDYSRRDFSIELETRYYYRIQATSPNVNSAFTQQDTVFTFLRTPTNLIVNAITTTRNSITWQNNSAYTTGYEIQRSLTSGTGFVQIRINPGANNNSYVDNDVLPNTVYYYRVRALGQEANSEFSVEAIISIFPPSNLAATTISANAIQLNWQNNAANILGTIIERSEIGQNQGFSIVATVGNTFTSYLDEGLTVDKQYFYRVKGYNANDTSATSNVAGAITADVPIAANNLVLAVISKNQINLTWNDNAQNENSFRIERANILEDEGLFKEIAVISSVGAGVGQIYYQDKALQPNQTYTYRVRASNDDGNSPYSNTASATTLIDPLFTIPEAPTNLVAEAVSDDQINLRWSSNDESVVIFKIDRSTSPNGPFTAIAEVPATRTRFPDIGLINVPSPGNAYFYRVRASNQAGESEPSDTVSTIALCNVVMSVSSDAVQGSICVGKAATLTLTTNATGASFQWRRSGANIAGATLPTYIASEDGVYSCQVRSGSCILSSNDVAIVVRETFAVNIAQSNDLLTCSITDGSEYQWYKDFQAIANANEDTYKPTESGSYFVTVTRTGCSSTSNVIVVTITANEAWDISNSLRLAPVPTQNQVLLKIDSGIQGDYQCNLIDVFGKAVCLDKGNKNRFSFEKTLNLTRFPAGVYLLEVQIGKYRGLKKVVKQ
jgi:hypothetical protein